MLNETLEFCARSASATALDRPHNIVGIRVMPYGDVANQPDTFVGMLALMPRDRFRKK
jgi:hypothetical protein